MLRDQVAALAEIATQRERLITLLKLRAEADQNADAERDGAGVAGKAVIPVSLHL